MKIAMPVDEKIVNPKINNTFGRTPYFVIYDTNNEEYSFIDNSGNASQGGAGIKAAQAIVDAARKTAQAAHDKIMADTKAEQDQVIATAKEAIALEQKKAMDEVRAQVINLSMIAASKIVEQKLGSEEDKKMASKIVDSIMK